MGAYKDTDTNSNSTIDAIIVVDKNGNDNGNGNGNDNTAIVTETTEQQENNNLYANEFEFVTNNNNTDCSCKDTDTTDTTDTRCCYNRHNRRPYPYPYPYHPSGSDCNDDPFTDELDAVVVTADLWSQSQSQSQSLHPTPQQQQQQQQQQLHSRSGSSNGGGGGGSSSILRNTVVLSILVTETAERIAYFGFRSGLVLYFVNGLEFSEPTSVSLVAAVHGLAYLSPLLGAILADNGWGRYTTISRFAVVYAIGLCLLALGAMCLDDVVELDHLDHHSDLEDNGSGSGSSSSSGGDTSSDANDANDTDFAVAARDSSNNLLVARLLSFAGLFLACLGTGGIKPCVSAFGADQVILADNDDGNDDGNDNSTTATATATATTATATATTSCNKNATTVTYSPVDTSDDSTTTTTTIRQPADAKPQQQQQQQQPQQQRDQTTAVPLGTAASPEREDDTKADNDDDNNNNNNDDDNDDDPRLREFFNSYYFCINVGALVSFGTVPVVRAKYGFGASFFVPACFMVAALGVFWSQRSRYKHRTAQRRGEDPPLLQTLSLVGRMLLQLLPLPLVVPARYTYTNTNADWMVVAGGSRRDSEDYEYNDEYDDYECEHDNNNNNNNNNKNDDKNNDDDDINGDIDDDRCSSELRKDAEQVVHLMPLMVFFPVFWMLYDQQGSVWTLQATRLNCHGLEPEQSLLLNPLEVMILIPFFDKIVYPWLASSRRGNNRLDLGQPLRRMEWGMFLTAVAFGLSTILEHALQTHPPQTVSLAWQIPQITVLTVGEILLNVTALQFCYDQAPDRMQSVILSVYLLTVAVGDGLGSVLFATVFRAIGNDATTLVVCAVCMLINLALFSRVAEHWEPYQQHNRTTTTTTTTTCQTGDNGKEEDHDPLPGPHLNNNHPAPARVEYNTHRSGKATSINATLNEQDDNEGMELTVLATNHRNHGILLLS